MNFQRTHSSTIVIFFAFRGPNDIKWALFGLAGGLKLAPSSLSTYSELTGLFLKIITSHRWSSV